MLGSTLDALYGPATDQPTLVALRRACSLRHQIALRLVAYDSERTPFLLTLQVAPMVKHGKAEGLLFCAQRAPLPQGPIPSGGEWAAGTAVPPLGVPAPIGRTSSGAKLAAASAAAPLRPRPRLQRLHLETKRHFSAPTRRLPPPQQL